MAVRIVLLRGVNVGRHRRMPMAELRAVLERAGHDVAATVGQSGNVVLRTSARPRALERELGELLGVDVGVRTRDELARVLADDPLAEVADNGSRELVTFLREPLSAGAAREIAAAAVEPEVVDVRKRQIYSWHPHGLHDSPLAKAIGAAVKSVGGTNRNRNTLEKLLDAAR